MPIWFIRCAGDEPRACASVLATTKSTPDRPETIMLLIALPPAPPTPHTTMRGFSSFSWGAFRLIGIPCLCCYALADAPPPAVERLARHGSLFRRRRHATQFRLSQAFVASSWRLPPLWLTRG